MRWKKSKDIKFQYWAHKTSFESCVHKNIQLRLLLHIWWWRYVVWRWYGEREWCIYLKYSQINFHVKILLSTRRFYTVFLSPRISTTLQRMPTDIELRWIVYIIWWRTCAHECLPLPPLWYTCCLCSSMWMWHIFHVIYNHSTLDSTHKIDDNAVVALRERCRSRQITTIPRPSRWRSSTLSTLPCTSHSLFYHLFSATEHRRHDVVVVAVMMWILWSTCEFTLAHSR